MNCQETSFLLDASSNEELTVLEKQAAERHFESCRACREMWAAYREVSALRIPATPQVLRSRIAVTSNEVRDKRVPLIVGSVLAVAAAAAAALVIRITDAPSDHEEVGEQVPLAPIRPSDAQGRSPSSADGAAKAADPEAERAGDSADSRADHALDPNTIVVVAAPHPGLDPERTALFREFYEAILRHLRAVPNLNVARSDVVDLFLRSGTPEEEIARNLGAAHLVAIWTTSSDPAAHITVTSLDMTTGAATGKMAVSGAFDARWPATLESDASKVGAFIKEGLTPITPAQRRAAFTEARATVLNAALPARERVTALRQLSRSPDVQSDAMVAAAVELATNAPGWRVHIWSAMYGVDNPYLIQPLIDSLSYDSDEHVRRQAASSLRTFATEPRVRAALERAQASDPAEAVREAAQRALLSQEEIDRLALQKLLDETLPVRERLMATTIIEGGSVRAVPLTKEAARAVFEIGATATDPDIRGWAWSRLAQNDVNDPEFPSVLLDDLRNSPNDEVRAMAARALAPYVDDPVVRAALERAASGASYELRHAARRALGEMPD